MRRAAGLAAACLASLACAQDGFRGPGWYGPPSAPQAHHPVGRPLPGPDVEPGFNQPVERGAGLAFFDANGNGVPDDDEVRFYGPERRVECGSCHGEPPRGVIGSVLFLRVANDGSRLCLICHRI